MKQPNDDQGKQLILGAGYVSKGALLAAILSAGNTRRLSRLPLLLKFS
jgi:hypothetical protein